MVDTVGRHGCGCQQETRVRRLGVVVLLLLTTSCASGHRITRLEDNATITDTDRAAYYALPRTLLQVSVKAKRVVVAEDTEECFSWLLRQKPSWTGFPTGDTVAEALGVDPELEVGTTFKLDGAPELTVLAEPDPGQIFRAELGAPFFVKRKIELAYGPLGVLHSGTSLAKDRTLDWVTTAATVFLPFDVKMKESSWKKFEKELQAQTQANACRPHQRALEAAVVSLQQIQASIEADAIDRATASWLAQRQRSRIEAIVASLWSRVETPGTILCLVRPEDGTGRPRADHDVLLYSKKSGFVELSKADCSIPADLRTSDAPVDAVELRLTLERDEDEQLVDRFRKAGLGGLPVDKSKPQGFYYRIPAVARVSLTSGNCVPREVDRHRTCLPDPQPAEPDPSRKTILERDVVVAQYGIVAALPPQHAVEAQYDITLDPLTGALMKLTSTSEAADPKLLSDLGAAIQKDREADAKAEKEAAAAEDELALLERKRKLLEEQLKIRELEEKLGIDGP